MGHRQRKPLLNDEQWRLIEPLLPALPKSKKGGRRWAPNRAVLEGILWILRTGARWQFRTRQKRGPGIGPTKRGKGTKWMVVVDGQGVPLGVYLEAASPAEVNLLKPTLATIAVPRAGAGRPRQKPQRVIADKAYDSDPLRARLKRRGIELIAPHRQGRKRAPTQDGRKLRRYRKRWKVERTFSWFGNYRRLVVR